MPAPLPPGDRTVGQLVAETIRAYGERFWQSLVLGIPLGYPIARAWMRSTGAPPSEVFWSGGPHPVAWVVDEMAAIPLDLYARERGLTKVTTNLMGF